MFSLEPWMLFCALEEGSEGVDGETPQDIVNAWANSGGINEPGLSSMFLSLFVVILLIFCLAWVAKRYLRFPGSKNAGSGLRVLETLPLGGKKMIHVVHVHGRNLVVGASGDRIDLLTELSEEEVDPESLLEKDNHEKLSKILPFTKKLNKTQKTAKVK